MVRHPSDGRVLEGPHLGIDLEEMVRSFGAKQRASKHEHERVVLRFRSGADDVLDGSHGVVRLAHAQREARVYATSS